MESHEAVSGKHSVGDEFFVYVDSSEKPAEIILPTSRSKGNYTVRVKVKHGKHEIVIKVKGFGRIFETSKPLAEFVLLPGSKYSSSGYSQTFLCASGDWYLV